MVVSIWPLLNIDSDWVTLSIAEYKNIDDLPIHSSIVGTNNLRVGPYNIVVDSLLPDSVNPVIIGQFFTGEGMGGVQGSIILLQVWLQLLGS